MRRETAYKLAGRKHDARVSGAGLEKVRRITFAEEPHWQCEQAFQSLRTLKDLEVRALEHQRTLEIRYSVLDHSLEMIEAALREAPFQAQGGERRVAVDPVETERVDGVRRFEFGFEIPPAVPSRLLQSMHSSGSMARKFGPSRKQSTGQTSTQSVYLQRIQASVTT